MNEIGTPIKPAAPQGQSVANKAAETVKDGVRSAQNATDQMLDKLSSKVDDVGSQAAPLLDEAPDQARKLMQQGREALHDTSQMLKERATQASELAVGYAKDEPMKAMLIAAGVGALLMSLLAMMARSRD